MYTFIINPNSRSGRGSKVWGELESTIKEQGINYQVYFTKYQRQAINIAREISSDGERHTIVVLGGDGTMNEVVNGIVNPKNITLGYIPIGSSNDFARGLKLSTDPATALSHILTPREYTYIDVGILSYQNKKRRFSVSAGIGFDAAVCHQIMISKLKVLLNKIGLGKLSYAGVAISRMISLSPGKMLITLDDERKMEFESVIFAAAMNQPFEGGGFKFCPKADPGDGTLNLMVAANISRLKALLFLPTAFFGLHTRIKGIYTFTFRKMELESEKPLPVHTDGEPIFLQRNITVSLEPEKLRIIRS